MGQASLPWRNLLLLILLMLLTRPSFICAAESNESSQLAVKDKEGCIRNLKTIYAAVQAYQKDQKDLPNWFSDLVPKYLPDVTVLMCPVSRRTGKTGIDAAAFDRGAGGRPDRQCPGQGGGARLQADCFHPRPGSARQL